MLIVCPTCASEYRLDPDRMGAGGRRVRCSSCGSAWFATPVEEDVAPPAAPPTEDTLDPGSDVWRSAETPAGDDDAGTAMVTPGPGAPADDPFAGRTTEEFIDDEWRKAAEAEEEAARALALSQEPSLLADGKGAGKGRGKAGKISVKAPRPSLWSRVTSPGAIAVTGFMLLGLGVLQREAVVRLVPDLAGPFAAVGLPVNVRGLTFDGVSSTLVVDPSGRFLVVEGELRNVTRRSVRVPPIEAIVRDEAGLALYSWTAEPPRQSLGGGEAMTIRTRLASPPEAGRDVMLRFARGSVQVAANPR